jgi:hypothetical protein
MKFINANKLHRKSGGLGDPALVRAEKKQRKGLKPNL